MRSAWLCLLLAACAAPRDFPKLQPRDEPAPGFFIVELLSVELLAEPPAAAEGFVDVTPAMLEAILRAEASVYRVQSVRAVGRVGEEACLVIPGNRDPYGLTIGGGADGEYLTHESFLTFQPRGDSADIECEIETVLDAAPPDGAPPPSSSRRYLLEVAWPLSVVPMFIIPRGGFDDGPRRTQLLFVRAWGG